MKKSADQYLEKASQLNKEEIRRVLARMRSRRVRAFEHKNMSVLEIVAGQLAVEDDELEEWRARMTEIRKKSESKQLLESSTR